MLRLRNRQIKKIGRDCRAHSPALLVSAARSWLPSRTHRTPTSPSSFKLLARPSFLQVSRDRFSPDRLLRRGEAQDPEAQGNFLWPFLSKTMVANILQDAAGSPYINHPLGVANLIASVRFPASDSWNQFSTTKPTLIHCVGFAGRPRDGSRRPAGGPPS